MRILYIIPIITIIILALSSVYSACAEDILFGISSDKKEYDKNKEPIFITFKLENKGKEAVYVNNRFHINAEESAEGEREIYFSVTSPSGEKMPCNKTRGDISLPRTDNFVLLEAGKDITSGGKKNLRGYFDFKELGSYKVQATYHSIYGREIGLDVFNERLTSRPITINIKE